jgi:serine/threonine protein kinase
MVLKSGQIQQDRYRIDALLGRGEDGRRLYRFRSPVQQARGIKENFQVSAEAERQFPSEAGLLHHLRHPNLPRVHASSVLSGQGQYLVMDYVSSGRDESPAWAPI